MILKRLAVAVADGAEAVEVFGEREVVLVVGVGLDAGEDGVVGDEAGDVVDVAVGVVAGDAAVEPDGLVDAEVVVEGLLELRGCLFVPTPGLRCWTSERRHSSVVRRMPSPLTSMEPPSRTRRWGLPSVPVISGRNSSMPLSLATWWGIWSSRCQLGYFAQALKRQLVMAMLPSGFLTKMGPESRSQTRSVSQWWKWRRARLAPARRSMLVRGFSVVSLLTRMWTSSQQARLRTISA